MRPPFRGLAPEAARNLRKVKLTYYNGRKPPTVALKHVRRLSFYTLNYLFFLYPFIPLPFRKPFLRVTEEARKLQQKDAEQHQEPKEER